MKPLNLILTIVFFIFGTNIIMAQNNYQFKEIYKPVKTQIKKDENIKVLKKVKIKGAQLKIQGKFKEEIPLLMQGNMTYRCYLASLENNKQPI